MDFEGRRGQREDRQFLGGRDGARLSPRGHVQNLRYYVTEVLPPLRPSLEAPGCAGVLKAREERRARGSK